MVHAVRESGDPPTTVWRLMEVLFFIGKGRIMIFCKNCKYFDDDFYILGECKSKPIKKISPLEIWYKPERCFVKNRKNDCREFEVKKTWWRLICEKS